MWYVILIIEAYDIEFLLIEFVINYAGLQLYLKRQFLTSIFNGEIDLSTGWQISQLDDINGDGIFPNHNRDIGIQSQMESGVI